MLFLLLVAAGPLDEIEAAKSSSALPTTIFVSMLGTAQADREKLEVAFDIALNGTTFRRRPVHLTPVPGKSKTLFSIDYEELEWDAKAVEALLLKEPYFYPIDPTVKLIRADWFIKEATFGDSYYSLLGFGKTLAELDKRVGLDRKSAENLRAFTGARVVESGVSLNPRSIARLGSTLGGYWQTNDVADPLKGNPFERIDDLVLNKPDAHELFGPLPNGLFWWALADGKGNLQNSAPTNIAADRRVHKAPAELKDVTKEKPSYRVMEVQNPHSCLGCHALGLRAASDFIAGAVEGGKLDVRTYDKRTAGRIEDFFDQKNQAESMRDDSAAFQRAVERVTGKKPLAALNIFSAVRWAYDEQNVSTAQAAAELNVTVEEFDKACRAGEDIRLSVAYWLLSKGQHENARFVLGLDVEGYTAFVSGKAPPLGSSTLRALVTGTAIPRGLWERVAYPEAALLVCYQTGSRAKATMQMVREKALPVKTPERKKSIDATTGRPIEFNDSTGQWEFSKEAAK